MAARLCDYARGVQVLMPTMQLQRLPEGVTAEPYGEIELRGFPGPIDVVSLSGRAAVAESRRFRALDAHAVHLTGNRHPHHR